MEIYLVRHGEAVSEHVKGERPLSERGMHDVSAMAEHLSRLEINVARIYHSDRLRAKQTAQIIAQKVRPSKGLQEVQGLAPADDIDTALKLIEDAGEPVMIVGHLPHLGKLLSALLIGREYQGMELLEFDAGSVVCLAEREGKWLVRQSLSRKALPS